MWLPRRYLQLLAALGVVALVLYVAGRLLSIPLFEWPQIKDSEPQPPLTVELREYCRHLRRGGDPPPALSGSEGRQTLAWLCGRVDTLLPWPSPAGCGRTVTYPSSETRLEQRMLHYAVLFGFSRLLAAEALVEPDSLLALRRVFPNVSLPAARPEDMSGQPVSFWASLALLRCRPDGVREPPRRYRVTGPPDGSSVDLFQPVRAELRREFSFSAALRRQAAAELRSARGRRSSATFIGVQLEAAEGHHRPPPDLYLARSLDHYRRRFADALFVVGSSAATRRLVSAGGGDGGDVVSVGTAAQADPALWLAVRAACNHAMVVSEDGFWGAYLAGGEVLAPRVDEAAAAGYGWLPLHTRLASEDDRWLAVEHGDESGQ